MICIIMRYRTEQPNTILQRMGWGRVKGPLGKAKMDITIK